MIHSFNAPYGCQIQCVNMLRRKFSGIKSTGATFVCQNLVKVGNHWSISNVRLFNKLDGTPPQNLLFSSIGSTHRGAGGSPPENRTLSKLEKGIYGYNCWIYGYIMVYLLDIWVYFAIFVSKCAPLHWRGDSRGLSPRNSHWVPPYSSTANCCIFKSALYTPTQLIETNK